MSSNIRVQRICQLCNIEFTAKTTVTKYCGDSCAKKAYKKRKREENIKTSNQETEKTISIPFEILKNKEFLTIAEACTLLSVGRSTLWRKIKNEELKVLKVGRRVIIKRSDLDNFLKSN
ncbi:MAG: helix-turn-helix domain-containing protein [Flavobacteriaceae bacterium]|nr:helix-turn-helix domain-containing protein [Flavobacteriaceae bacterium]